MQATARRSAYLLTRAVLSASKNSRAVDRYWSVSERELRARDRDSNRVRASVSEPFDDLLGQGVPEAVFAIALPRSREAIAQAVGLDRLKQYVAIVNIDIDRAIRAIGVPGPAFDEITVGVVVVAFILRSRRIRRSAGIAGCEPRLGAYHARRKRRAAPHISRASAVDQFVRWFAGTLERILLREVQTVVLQQNPGGVVSFEFIQPPLSRRPGQGRACGIGILSAPHHSGHARLQVIIQIKTIEDTGRVTRPGMLVYIINALIAGTKSGEELAAFFLSHRQPPFDLQFLCDRQTSVSQSQYGQNNPYRVLER